MKKMPSEDDRELINFLKQNKPFVPQEKAGFEEELINLVDQQNSTETKQIEPLVWFFPGLVLFGVLLAINSEQPYGYKFADRESRSNPAITNNNQELETFVVNSWENVIYYNNATEKVVKQNSDLSLSGVK